jgi:hypothetical protein
VHLDGDQLARADDACEPALVKQGIEPRRDVVAPSTVDPEEVDSALLDRYLRGFFRTRPELSSLS